MTFRADELEEGARAATGLDDFGSPYYREGLERTVDALNTEADLSDMGQVIQHATISNALIQRLKVEDTCAAPGDRRRNHRWPSRACHRPAPHRDHGAEPAGGGRPSIPFVADVGIAGADSPTRDRHPAHRPSDRPAEAGLQMLNDMFPLMKTLYNSEATAATECQDLMGMSFRTFHFDGVVRVPGYLAWLMSCDMRGRTRVHRVLKLLQWHCPPTLWHLKTPVHVFALDALVEAYPNAKFMWSHRDPAKVMGSVCSLIRYVRSWSSDRDDPEELGAEQLDSWSEGIRRAMDFRNRVGDERFSDVAFADLQADPVNTLASSYESLGLDFTDATARSVERWAGERAEAPAGHRLRPSRLRSDADGVRERFAEYLRATITRQHDSADDAATRKAGARPKRPPRSPFRSVEIRSRTGGPRAQHRCRSGARATEHPRLLPSLRLEGPVGCGGLSRDGTCRDAKAANEDGQHPDAVEAVAAWVDARLDLAFEEHIKSDLRRLSLEAQSQMFASPELIQPACRRDARAPHRTAPARS